MKILITGSKGFIGKNLKKILSSSDYADKIFEYDKDNTLDELENYCSEAEIVFHLAAILRPSNEIEFENNISLTERIIKYLKKYKNRCPIMFASSIQATLNNPYAECKRTEERKLIEYGKKNGVNVFVFRFPNLFGTMSRPNYTSVVATFCYNTIKEKPIIVNNPSVQMKFAFVENVLNYVCYILFNNMTEKANQIIDIEDYYCVGLGELCYYMETLKRNVPPAIIRKDDFYNKLEFVFHWYEENIYQFE